MQKDNIIQKGDTAKYQLTITHADFDQQRDDFFVILHYGMAGGTTRICKKQMPHDEDGNWFLLFQTANLPLGQVKAETHYMVPDGDIEGGVREQVEWDWLCFITESPCPQFAMKCKCQHDEDDNNNHVEFKRTWRGDVESLYLKLLTAQGEPVTDNDGRQIMVRKTEE